MKAENFVQPATHSLLSQACYDEQNRLRNPVTAESPVIRQADLNPSKETSVFLDIDMTPLILINKNNLVWHVVVKTVTGSQTKACTFSNF